MKRLWFIEIWEEERDIFKSLIGHLLISLVLIGVLVMVNYIVGISSLHEDKKEMFEKFDFWGIIIIFSITILSCATRVILISIKKIFYDK
jgi:hypothetical protein